MFTSVGEKEMLLFTPLAYSSIGPEAYPILLSLSLFHLPPLFLQEYLQTPVSVILKTKVNLNFAAFSHY